MTVSAFNTFNTEVLHFNLTFIVLIHIQNDGAEPKQSVISLSKYLPTALYQ